MVGIKAVIIVGGPRSSTRFRPLSLDVPKPLFPLAGKSLAGIQLDACVALEGLKEVLFIGYDQSEIWIERTAEFQVRYDISVRYLCETKPHGPAGCLYHFRDQIMKGNPDNIILLHCDVCCDFDLKGLLEFHIERSSLFSIVCTKVPNEHANNFGVCVAASGTRELLHYVEKPEYFSGNLINCGIYCINHKIFSNLDYWMSESSTLKPGRLFMSDIIKHLVGTAEAYVYKHVGFWRQMIHAGSALYCNDFFLDLLSKVSPSSLTVSDKKKPLLFFPYSSGMVSDSSSCHTVSCKIIEPVSIDKSACIASTACIGPNVSIGPNVTVDQGVRVVHSIILDGAHIKPNACIINSIVGWDSVICKWARCEGTDNSDPFYFFAGENSNGRVNIIGSHSKVGKEVIVRNCIVLPHKVLSENSYDEIIL